MAIERDEEQRRRDAEDEERHHWDSVEDERLAEEERIAKRESAIETMEAWFFEQFEDPQIRTPSDGEDQTYIFPWGGPFEAGDVLHGAFSHDFDAEWIQAAAERIERDGTLEWAPTREGDYYEHPDPEEESPPLQVAQLSADILARLDALEAIVATLPTTPSNLGHNSPPEHIGLPPYTDETAAEVVAAIAETRAELTVATPDPAKLETLSKRYEGWGMKIGAWLAGKGNLIVDEFIKNSVKLGTLAGFLGLFTEIADKLTKLAHALLGMN
jgi:hypothetical protein